MHLHPVFLLPLAAFSLSACLSGGSTPTTQPAQPDAEPPAQTARATYAGAVTVVGQPGRMSTEVALFPTYGDFRNIEVTLDGGTGSWTAATNPNSRLELVTNDQPDSARDSSVSLVGTITLNGDTYASGATGGSGFANASFTQLQNGNLEAALAGRIDQTVNGLTNIVTLGAGDGGILSRVDSPR